MSKRVHPSEVTRTVVSEKSSNFMLSLHLMRERLCCRACFFALVGEHIVTICFLSICDQDSKSGKGYEINVALQKDEKYMMTLYRKQIWPPIQWQNKIKRNRNTFRAAISPNTPVIVLVAVGFAVRMYGDVAEVPAKWKSELLFSTTRAITIQNNTTMHSIDFHWRFEANSLGLSARRLRKIQLASVALQHSRFIGRHYISIFIVFQYCALLKNCSYFQTLRNNKKNTFT